MAAFQMDPVTLQRILETLPEYQKRSRRAKKLRKSQEGFEAMRDKDQPLGSVSESVGYGGPASRASFAPLGSYIPNYQGMADKLIGGLGGLYTDKLADREEDELNALRNPEVIGTIQQMSGPGAPGASPGPVGAFSSAGNELEKVLGMSTPSPVISEQQMGGATNPFQPASGNVAASPDSSLAGQAQNDDPEAWYQAVEQAESTGDQSAVSPVGARGVMQLMPPTARELERTLGMPPGLTDIDANANRMAGRKYLDDRMKARNGDRRLALMDYNWGMGNVDKWLARGADPSQVPPETSAYVDRVTQLATGGKGMGAAEVPQAPQTATATIPPEIQAQGAAPMGAAPAPMGATEPPLPLGEQNPTDETLRAYLGMLGAEDLGISPEKNRLFSTIEDREGNVYQQYADGRIVPTGLNARSKGVQYKYDELRRRWYKFDPTYGPSEVGSVPAGVRATTTDGREMSADEVAATGVGTDTGAGAGIGAQLSPGEKKAQEAPIEIATAAAKDVDKAALDRRESARTALSKTNLTSDPGAQAAKRLLTHPGLRKITAGTMGSYADAIGRKDDQGGYSFFGMGALARPILAQNDPEAADALAMMDQIRGSAFATGFQALVGQGAGSISNQEGQGIARALANMETARSESALRQALNEYITLTDNIKARWEREAAGGNSGLPGVTSPAASQGVDAELEEALKAWGGN